MNKIPILIYRKIERLRLLVAQEVGVEYLDRMEQELPWITSAFERGQEVPQVLEEVKAKIHSSHRATEPSGSDEWAMIIKHQDEVQRLADYQRRINDQNRKKQYKEELDSFARSKQVALSHQKEIDSAQDQQLQNVQSKMTQFSTNMEQEQRLQRMNAEKEVRDQSLHLATRNQELQLKQNQLQDLQYKRFVEKKEQNFRELEQMYSLHLLQRQREMNEFNARQLENKRLSLQKERDLDKSYSNSSFQHKDSSEERRLKRLDDFKKTPVLFQTPPSLYQKSRQDEIKAMESQRIHEQILRERDMKRAYDLKAQAVSNRETLMNQIHHKKQVQLKEKEDDRAYMKSVKSKEEELRDRDRRNSHDYRLKQQEYYRSLSSQVNEKNSFSSSKMTEHERRINNREIYASSHKEVKVFSKVPGLVSNPFSPNLNSGFVRSKGDFMQKLHNPDSRKALTPSTLSHYGRLNLSHL